MKHHRPELTWGSWDGATGGSDHLQLGLASFEGAHATNWPVVMAASLMSQAPVLLAFLLAQRFFVRSIATTGSK